MTGYGQALLYHSGSNLGDMVSILGGTKVIVLWVTVVILARAMRIVGLIVSDVHIIIRCDLCLPTIYPMIMDLAIQKSDISVMVYSMWCPCHDSRPISRCCDMNLGPIPSVLKYKRAMIGLTWPSTSCITPMTMWPGYAMIWSIWDGLQYVVPLPWLEANEMVLTHPFETYTKCVAIPGSNYWALTTLNTMHHPLTNMGLGHAKKWHIRGGWSCVVPLTWLNATVIVLEPQCGTNTKCMCFGHRHCRPFPSMSL